MGLRKWLVAGLLVAARADELEFEDEEEEDVYVDGKKFPKTFEDLMWNAPPMNVTMLTAQNFDEAIGDKVAFINFCASYMTPCKLLQTDWGLLWKDYEENEEGKVIAQVDCHKEQPLCDRFGITSLPTLMYGGVGDSSEMVAYEEGRGINALRAFVQFGLKHPCTPTNKDHCTIEQQIELARYVTMDEDELDAFNDKLEMKMNNIGADYGAKMWTLQQQYQTAIGVKEKKIRKLIATNYGVMLEVRRIRDENGETFPALEALRQEEEDKTAALDALIEHKKQVDKAKEEAEARGETWPPPELEAKMKAAAAKMHADEAAKKAAAEVNNDGTTA